VDNFFKRRIEVMKIWTLSVPLALLILLFSLTSVVNAGTDEKAMMLKTSCFGDLSNSKIIKGKEDKAIDISVYPGTVMTTGNRQHLSVTYDEVWEVLDKRVVIGPENKLDITRLYWNDDKLQGVSVDRYFETTKKRETTDIFDREYVLQNAF
jgi:hypothetical protein